MAPPPVVPIGPLALAAHAYWTLSISFRLGAAIGAAHVCRNALSSMIEAHAAEAWPALILSRVDERLPALAVELERVERQLA